MRFRERLFPFSWNAVTIFLLAMVAIAPAGLMWHWVSTSWVPLPFWDEWHTPGEPVRIVEARDAHTYRDVFPA